MLKRPRQIEIYLFKKEHYYGHSWQNEERTPKRVA